ncbi:MULTISPECIES: CheB methylesterase domain-containing protein [unclassified Rhodosalinus]|uniref:CheB methylesterase domain-containing protein n=1 Tax=unclassified Rhodosalinus TaxID=2630183 RepID=UPI003523F510
MNARPEGGLLVCIGASTGGIAALEAILPLLPRDAPPTLVVQHIPGRFAGGLATRLARHCAGSVREAKDGMELKPGSILFAPGGDRHLAIDPSGRRCRLVEGPPCAGHRPSVDVLFQSAARHGRRAVGVLLTGMGRDGAAGLAAIRAAGGRTIAQSEESCTVYGMPRAAMDLGAVELSLPPVRIPAALRALAAGPPREGQLRRGEAE